MSESSSDLIDDGVLPQADSVLEMHGDRGAPASCAVLTPAIQARLKSMASGQVLEVRVDDPAAREDVLSWSRLSGHALLGMFADEGQGLRFYLRKK